MRWGDGMWSWDVEGADGRAVVEGRGGEAEVGEEELNCKL